MFSSGPGAIHGLAGTPSILMPTLMQWKGRKLAFIVACIIFTIGWILAYVANTAAVILAGEFFHGFGSNSIYAITCLTVTEMVAPEYRDSFMQMYLLVSAFIMTLNGLMTHYLHYKMISIILCLPMIPVIIIACLWPESPYWLACKGRFDECEKSFLWLRGADHYAKKELKELIVVKKETIEKQIPKKMFRNVINVIKQRDFYLPAAHIIVIQFLIHCSGGLVILIYAIEIFKTVTDSEEISFYGGFVLNALQLLGVTISVIIGKYLNKKSILLGTAGGLAISLFGASIISFLQSTGALPRSSIICLFFLASYACIYGFLAMGVSIASSLMPVKHRGIGGVLYIVSNTCVWFTLTMKTYPYLVFYIGLGGTFLVYAINCTVAGLIIWKCVPETRGRTLQELENFYMFGKFVDRTGSDTYTELVRLEKESTA